jgi:hypothetical protein
MDSNKLKFFLFIFLFALPCHGQSGNMSFTSSPQRLDPSANPTFAGMTIGSSGVTSSSYQLDDPTNLLSIGNISSISDDKYKAWPGLEVLADGRYIAVYYSGTSHTTSDGDILYAISSDHGQTWPTTGTLLAHTTAQGYRNPEVSKLANGHLLVSFQIDGINPPYVRVVDVTVSGSTVTVGTPVVINDTYTRYDGVASKPFQLANGRILLPVYGINLVGSLGSDSTVWKSDDNGATWSQLAVIAAGTASHYYDETNIVQVSSGKLIAFIRDDGDDVTPLGIARSYSSDSGATWSTPTLVWSVGTALWAGKPAVAVLPGDRIVLITGYSTVSTPLNRNPYWGISSDEGLTFSAPAQMPLPLGVYNMEYSSIIYQPGGVLSTFTCADGLGLTDCYFVEFYDGYGVSASAVRGANFYTPGRISSRRGTLVTGQKDYTYLSTVTWNDSAGTTAYTHQFIDITDTSSAASSLIADWRIDGTSRMKVDKRGRMTLAAELFTTDIMPGSANYINWQGRSAMSSPLDGIVLFQNNSINGFTRMNFGGTTSSFPALAVNGSGLKVVAADGTTPALLTATSDVFHDTANTGPVLKDTVTGLCARIVLTSGALVPTTVTCPDAQ